MSRGLHAFGGGHRFAPTGAALGTMGDSNLDILVVLALLVVVPFGPLLATQLLGAGSFATILGLSALASLALTHELLPSSTALPAPERRYPRSYFYERADPIDKLTLDPRLLDSLARAARAVKLTPNAITVLSAIAAVLSGWLIYSGQVALAFPPWAAHQLLDNLDGYMARKYKLCSKLGAFADEFVDTVGCKPLAYPIVART